MIKKQGRSIAALWAALALSLGVAQAQEHGVVPTPPVFVANGGPSQGLVDSLNWKTSQPMVSMYDKWARNEATRVGRHERPEAAAQGPLPACFAAAASQALDMKLCDDEPDPKAKGKRKSVRVLCKNMALDSRVSSLWLSKVGGRSDGATVSRDITMPEAGGSALGALRYALAMEKTPSLGSCSWPRGSDPLGMSVEEQRMAEARLAEAKYAKGMQSQWEKEGAASYMAKFWAAKWAKSVQSAFPSLKDELSRGLSLQDSSDALGAALWTPGCEQSAVALPSGAKAASKAASKDMAENLETLRALLASGREPIVTLCLDATPPKNWSGCKLRHAMVVIGLAKFEGTGDKDSGWGLWALNSWGERWQKASADGWVRAEPIMHRLEDEFIWIEPADKAPFVGSTVWPSYAEETAKRVMAERAKALGASMAR
jgi:hypothetical protein